MGSRRVPLVSQSSAAGAVRCVGALSNFVSFVLQNCALNFYKLAHPTIIREVGEFSANKNAIRGSVRMRFPAVRLTCERGKEEFVSPASKFT